MGKFLPLGSCDFTDSDGVTLSTKYNTQTWGVGCEVIGNGYQATAAGSIPSGELFDVNSTPDVDKRPTLPDNHYASVKVVATGNNHCPACGVRCAIDAGQLDGYWVTPGQWIGNTILYRADNNTFTVLATGAGASVNDTLDIWAQGTTIHAGRNRADELSAVDANYSSGDPALFGHLQPGSAYGDDFEFGLVDFYVPQVRRPNRSHTIKQARRDPRVEKLRRLIHGIHLPDS